MRNCWQALECLFGFLWCLWCLVFFTLPLKWSQGHCFFGSLGTVMSFLLGALRNQSLHSHSWLPSWSHLLGAWRWSRWPLATPGFRLLETIGISISGSNRRREEIRILIAIVGAAVRSPEESVEGSQLEAPGLLRMAVWALIPGQCSH